MIRDAGTGEREAPESAAKRDWAGIIRRRLRGSTPRHDPDQWLTPGSFESSARRHPLPREPVPAAVLMPLVERHELTALFTQRATQLRNHAGQISFPGGRIEAADAGPAAAALREAREEIGLDERFVSVIGYLPDHVVITGFRITPVVAFVQPGFELLLASEEVEDTFEVPLDYLFDPANHRLQRRRSSVSGEELEFREIPFDGRTIWGATAGMLLTLYRICTGPQPP
ncbi:MAG TPA: CoA pyrophosphatase [Steroidobacteraceae bacterium]|nr:CoA pyrophosphatase [Steroidobacteraceae bacterium]